jgi:hypothetical protein
MCFTCLNLSSGEFPFAGHIAATALGSQYLCSVKDDGGYNFYNSSIHFANLKHAKLRNSAYFLNFAA